MREALYGVFSEVCTVLFLTTPFVMWSLARREDYWSALLYPFALLFCVGWLRIRILGG